jgi:hypothetical protein
VPRTRCYRDGVLTDEDFPIADVSEHLAHPSAVVWADLCAEDLDDLQLVGDELGLHRLAVEDAAQGRQRPKVYRYDGTTRFPIDALLTRWDDGPISRSSGSAPWCSRHRSLGTNPGETASGPWRVFSTYPARPDRKEAPCEGAGETTLSSPSSCPSSPTGSTGAPTC